MSFCPAPLADSVPESLSVCPSLFIPSPILTLYTSKLSITASKQVYRSLSKVTTWKGREPKGAGGEGPRLGLGGWEKRNQRLARGVETPRPAHLPGCGCGCALTHLHGRALC